MKESHTEDPQTLGGTVQNVVTTTIWGPGFVHAWTSEKNTPSMWDIGPTSVGLGSLLRHEQQEQPRTVRHNVRTCSCEVIRQLSFACAHVCTWLHTAQPQRSTATMTDWSYTSASCEQETFQELIRKVTSTNPTGCSLTFLRFSVFHSHPPHERRSGFDTNPVHVGFMVD